MNSNAPNRISSLDALRGFALFGVLVTNIFLFNAPDHIPFDAYYASFTGNLQKTIVTIVHYFFRSRFYPIFSFLFGLGLGLQYLKLKAAQRSTAILWRRMLILFFIGLCHFIFIWDGDILLRYSVAGAFVILLAPTPPKVTLGAGVTLYFIHCLYAFTGSTPSQEISVVVTPVAELPYISLIQHRAAAILSNNFTIANGFYTLRITSFILMGLWVAKRYGPARLEAGNKVWGNLFLLFLLSRMAIAAVSFLLQSNHDVVVILSFLSSFLNIGIYITGFLLLVPMLGSVGLSRLFIAVGRMSLTNYIVQSVVMAFVFYDYGLGQYQKWEPVTYLLFASGLFVIQAMVSYVWLQKYKQGPLEALWRYLVNLPVQPRTSTENKK